MSYFGAHQGKQEPDMADAVSKPAMVTAASTGVKFNTTDQARIKAMDEAQAQALAWNKSQAEKGDAYAQLRMGQRYRDGDGVAGDLVLARAWLSKAAYQGHPQAIKELGELQKP